MEKESIIFNTKIHKYSSHLAVFYISIVLFFDLRGGRAISRDKIAKLTTSEVASERLHESRFVIQNEAGAS